MTETAGARTQAAIVAIVNWAKRPEVRARLIGGAGRELSPGDVHLLRAIVAAGSTRVSDIAESRGVDKSTVTPQVRRLEQRGLVEREPDEADRRAVRLRASTAGRSTCEAMNDAGAAVFDEVFSTWAPQDRQTFETMLARFVDDLNALADGPR